MYLGRLFSFEQTHDQELQNRKNKAWAKFAVFRSELTDKFYDLEKRVQLFQATVQPTLLYGCTCWTMTRERESQIRTLQRNMMRIIVGTKRRCGIDGDESWVEYRVRATRAAEDAMAKFGQPDWVEEVHRRRFQWAGRTARLEDNRWTREVLEWSTAGSRKRGRPKLRWTDAFNKFFQQARQASNKFWMELARDEASWKTLEDDYVNFALGRLPDFELVCSRDHVFTHDSGKLTMNCPAFLSRHCRHVLAPPPCILTYPVHTFPRSRRIMFPAHATITCSL